MDYMSGLSSVVSIVSFAIFAAGVMKIFQIAATLSEIKDILAGNKLHTPVPSAALSPMSSFGRPVPISSAQSGEEMLRAALSELDQPVNPASIELGNKS
jgi:hypothetical protein